MDHGGYAGIHVPEEAVFNAYGNGVIKTIGGSAGDGGGAISGAIGGGGGGGAGAGIGGNGGKGGDSNSTCTQKHYVTNNGHDGEDGESCGIINIYNSLTVYAYGGAGASGGTYGAASSGCGAGGYPGAGIGGGGAGGGSGDHMNGGGGYSAGVAENCTEGTKIVNGGELEEPETYSLHFSGGSYFYAHRYDGSGLNYVTDSGRIGGQGGSNFANVTNWGWYRDKAGDGGIAGKGGTIKVGNEVKVYAYNGNKYTDGTSYENGKNQLEIYAQNGILREVYKLNCYWGEDERYTYKYFNNLFGDTIAPNVDKVVMAGENTGKVNVLIRGEIVENNSRKIKSGYVNPDTKSVYGIGSGAGYIELSNGTYIVDEKMN